MEHPILFINVILEFFGLPVPHTLVGDGLAQQLCVPYMTYTWLVMAFLIIVPKFTMGNLEIMPGKGQNFWEIVIGGMEDFP
ncbi:MAG: F0F1 ATP synthase subunit A, partial [Desulfobulbaceae bacterium]|nr:F0F1 ATP synthase subunit A [Desulfobulbaceae bacterium]